MNFEQSDSIEKLTKALIVFQTKVYPIKKTKKGVHNASYAPLDEVLEAIKFPLAEAGISFVQFPCGDGKLITQIMHEGEWIRSSCYMKPVQDSPQGRGAVISYQRRYALGAVLGLATEDDDDADSGSGYSKNYTSAPKKGASLGKCKYCDGELSPSTIPGKKTYCIPCYKKWKETQKK